MLKQTLKRIRSAIMPWSSGPPPEWLQYLAGMFWVVVGLASAATLRVVNSVREGERERFWSPALLTEIPVVIVAYVVSQGIGEYTSMGPNATNALGCIFAFLGPKAAVSLLLT